MPGKEKLMIDLQNGPNLKTKQVSYQFQILN